MRIAEKTVELNFCKGFPLILGRDLFWFGLTQKQEAKAGFDACARAGSALLLFQLKASRTVLSDGSRRFLAEHQQMQILRNQVRSNRHVFYVLPMIGTTAEICHGLCFSHCSRYLDVSRIPSVVPKPFAKGKSPPVVRRNGCHYMDMDTSCSKVTIHSDPFTIDLVDANGMRELLGSLLPTGAFEIGLLITSWLLTGLGITVGYHRLFTHRTFKASPALRKFLAITASMAGQGSVTSWVALHRLHHERSDQLGDPHSPNMHGVGVWNRMKGIGKIIKVSSRTVVAHAEVLVERAGERKLVAFALATIAKVEGK